MNTKLCADPALQADYAAPRAASGNGKLSEVHMKAMGTLARRLFRLTLSFQAIC
jgi:hypothetical protein